MVKIYWQLSEPLTQHTTAAVSWNIMVWVAHTPHPPPPYQCWMGSWACWLPGHRPNIDYGGQGGAGMGKTLPNILTMIVWKIGKMKKKRVNSKSSSTETLGRNLLKIAGCIDHTYTLIIFDRHCSTNLFIELMNIQIKSWFWAIWCV